MPDAKQMSGIPRPVTDLPDRSISVRVIRGELSNNIPNQPVQLRVGDKVLTAKTDEAGRAQFDNVTPGATVKASTDVAGEHLESQEFPAPPRGGIRLMLVATDPSKAPATQPDAPAIKGDVVLGAESRIVVEPIEEAAQVFYLLDIANNARVPVNPPAPFEFDLPAGAVGATIMEGSSPNAAAAGAHISVQGPFPPGHTYVQAAYQMPATTGSLTVRSARAARTAGRREEVGRHDAVVRAGQGTARATRAGRGVHRGDRRSDCRGAAAAARGRRHPAPQPDAAHHRAGAGRHHRRHRHLDVWTSGW
jgi:hypothetical protein